MQKNNQQRNVVRAIERWYKRHGRTLPWRGIANPYRIFIAEIMLQQTQVHRVLEKYPEFLRRFPTLRSLACAKQRDVVVAWRGMGYNNRAVRLHKFAHAVLHNHRGQIPHDFDALIALPGIGRYTANALLSSAFSKRLPLVDINVRRVLSRIFWRMRSTAEMRTADEIWDCAEEILPHRNAYDWNQALMDMGALICVARKPKCDVCPVARLCASRATMKWKPISRLQREPSLNGIPNRLYRGRIIERLREVNDIRADVLGKAIHPRFSSRSEHWLRKLLSDLERDGLVLVRGNGSLQKTRVSLI